MPQVPGWDLRKFRLCDGEDEPFLTQDSHGAADGIAADVVFLRERGLRGE
jgi:hypothetical protein